MEDYEIMPMWAAGMHKGFCQYSARLMDQIRIQGDEAHFGVLRNALQGLPKLCRIVFADFREFAGPDEGYDELCGRMFGNTLEPNTASSLEGHPELAGIRRILRESGKEADIKILVVDHGAHGL
jgi:hypothetical protein